MSEWVGSQPCMLVFFRVRKVWQYGNGNKTPPAYRGERLAFIGCCHFVKKHYYTLTQKQVTSARHPCVTNTFSGGNFIPNDIHIGGSEPNSMLLTGPNMGGKSTYLRQVAVCAILAQVLRGLMNDKADRRTDRQTDRQSVIHSFIQTDRQTDRHSHAYMHMHT